MAMTTVIIIRITTIMPMTIITTAHMITIRITAVIMTATCARLTFTCWRMRSLQCSPSSRCSQAKYYGLTWMDPAMGLVGAAVIIAWAVSLIRSSGAVLLDTVPNASLSKTIRTRLEVNGDKVSDLHLRRLGPGHTGVIAALVSDRPQPPAIYKERLHGIEGLSHVTVEVHPCPHHHDEAA